MSVPVKQRLKLNCCSELACASHIHAQEDSLLLFFFSQSCETFFFQLHLSRVERESKRNVPLGLCWIKPLTSEHPPDLDVGISLHLPHGFSEAAPMIDV